MKKGVGVSRNLQTNLRRLAEFYMHVNHKHIDKLIEFDCGKIETSPLLFLFSIGGDEAPSSGKTFFVSFINARKRYAVVLRTSLFLGVMLKKMASLSRGM